MTELFNWFARARDRYVSLPRPTSEALTLGLALLAGLLVMPALIFLAGSYTLREYANGGAMALYVDFFRGLAELRPSCWIVVMGPYFFLMMFRAFRLVLRKI